MAGDATISTLGGRLNAENAPESLVTLQRYLMESKDLCVSPGNVPGRMKYVGGMKRIRGSHIRISESGNENKAEIG